MSEPGMVERVARSWYREHYRPHKEISDAALDSMMAATIHDGDCTNVAHTCWKCEADMARRVARAAIAAMREPTDAMITAGETQCGSYGNSEFAWENMIDAALDD